uniref:Synaptobrevin, longin-like domain protein n=1 Tax=Tanacetum cinerariifolium TaxID=118510 RepID=A0A6L2N3M3_TANCI|nr:hypothetical protein [Tanacetum cinerariifolium]
MIPILEKCEHNQDFHQIVDFVRASHIRYALTFNPTVNVSHIRQFWSTARIETTEEGTKILATVDGKLRTVSESSIRRNLKLNDEARISSLPDAKLFENLQLMGYNILPNQKFTFQKGQFSHQWKYLIHTIMQCLSPKSLTSSVAILPLLLRTRIAPSSVLPPVVDEPASPLGDDSQVIQHQGLLQKLDELTALCTSLQRQQSEMVSKFAAQELEIIKLKARVNLLEDREGGGIAQFGYDATIKERSLDKGEEVAKKFGDDTEEMANVLTSMDTASILTSGGVQVVPTAAEVETTNVSILTGSGVVSTASSTIPTAAPIFTTATESTPYTRRKGKETMVESETPKKKKVQEQIDVQLARELEEEIDRDTKRMNKQIAQDAEIARIHTKEELQMLIDGLDRNNETIAKYLQEYHQFATELPIERRIELISDLGMTLKEIKEKFDPVWKQFQDFIPIGSKEEAERFKRKGVRLEQDSSKKLKTSEEVPEEKLKEMMELIPHLDKEDLNQLWALVKETLNIRPAVNDKEKELWVELKRLYEPDVEDLLYTRLPIVQDSKIIEGILSSDEFPLPEQLPTAYEDKFLLLIQSDATVKKIAQLLKTGVSHGQRHIYTIQRRVTVTQLFKESVP